MVEPARSIRLTSVYLWGSQGRASFPATTRQSTRGRKNYINSLAEETEEAAYSGNMKQLYDTSNKLSGKYGRPERPVKDKDGKTIIGKEGQLNRWAEHFEELLNRPTSRHSAS